MLQLAHEAEISLGWLVGFLPVCYGMFRLVPGRANHLCNRNSADSGNQDTITHTQPNPNSEPNTDPNPYTHIHSNPHLIRITTNASAARPGSDRSG